VEILFPGGVFLGACFLDLFPDVKETVEEALAKLGQDPKKFPIPEFIMIYGLFVVLLLEQVVTQYQEQGIGPALGGHGHNHGGPSVSPPRGRTPEPDNPEEDEERPSDDAREKRPLLTPVPSPPTATANGYGTVLRSPRAEHRDFDGRVEAPVDVVNDSGSLDYSHAHARHQHSHGDGSTTVPNHHHHRHHHNEQLSDTHSALRSLLLLMALSLHSLFEGLALGLLKTNNDIVNIFSALIVSFGIKGRLGWSHAVAR
jgi:zinc transporter ZupT